jgi:hypothetical protein
MRSRWGKAQRRYREILREIRSHLSRNGMCGHVRALRLATPEYFKRTAIDKTKDDAREINSLAEKLKIAVSRKTLSPEMRLRLEHQMDGLLATLDAIQSECRNAESNQSGKDDVLLWCARTAFSLLVSSDRRPTSGSVQSPYRVIASLLYEIVTGERGHDLRRACDAHLKTMRMLLG